VKQPHKAQDFIFVQSVYVHFTVVFLRITCTEFNFNHGISGMKNHVYILKWRTKPSSILHT